jgi:hypothetical protein
MMEAASTSEMSVNFYQTTQRNNPEDGHLQQLFCLTAHKLLTNTSVKKLEPCTILFWLDGLIFSDFKSTLKYVVQYLLQQSAMIDMLTSKRVMTPQSYEYWWLPNITKFYAHYRCRAKPCIPAH